MPEVAQVPAPPVEEVDLGPRVRAGLTTAQEEFNLALTVGDGPGRARARRARLARWVGAPVAYVRQVHGAGVHVCRRPPVLDEAAVATADAVVTDRDDVALAVLVADCVPVLVADAGAGVAGVVHAGRRGLVAGVVPAAVEAMIGLGARPDRLRAVVGPAACGRCYEVPAALQHEVDQAVPGTASTTSWGTPALDLPAGVLGQLAAAGVRATSHGGCTIEDERWFSHRAAAGAGDRVEGRMAGVVRLLPPG